MVFSDGVTEAMDVQDQQFGQSRLDSLLPDCRHASAPAIIERIVEAVKQHTGSAPQHDDITLVVVKRLST